MKKINIVFFLGSFQAGGAEQLILQTLKLINRTKFNPFICVFEKRGLLLDEFQNLGIPIQIFTYKKSYTTLLNFSDFIFFLRKNKIDVVYVNLVGCYIFAIFGSVLAGVKNRILSWSNTYPVKRTKKYLHVLFGSHFANRIIAISNAVKLQNCKYYRIKPSKVDIVYCSTNINRWKVEKSIKKNYYTIGTIGRLVEQKGYDILLMALKGVINQYSDVKLEIIGTGYLENDLKRLSKELEVSNSVRFLGSLKNESVIKKMNSWSMFVLASRWEGFGIVLIEAMALEKPIVATKVDAIPEVVEDGVTGILCKSGDYQEIAQGITSLLNDKEKAIEMGRLGRKRVEKYFTIGKMVNELERIYLGEEL